MDWLNVLQLAAWTFISPLGTICGIIGFAIAFAWFKRAGPVGRVANFSIGLLLIIPLLLAVAVAASPEKNIANTGSSSGTSWLIFFGIYFLGGGAALSISWFVGIVFAIFWPPIEHLISLLVKRIATGGSN